MYLTLLLPCESIETLQFTKYSTFDHSTASAPVMEQPPQNVTALDGKDATISCRAVGAPNPNITWIYNGK